MHNYAPVCTYIEQLSFARQQLSFARFSSSSLHPNKIRSRSSPRPLCRFDFASLSHFSSHFVASSFPTSLLTLLLRLCISFPLLFFPTSLYRIIKLGVDHSPPLFVASSLCPLVLLLGSPAPTSITRSFPFSPVPLNRLPIAVVGFVFSVDLYDGRFAVGRRFRRTRHHLRILLASFLNLIALSRRARDIYI